jgi:hypothetical protein
MSLESHGGIILKGKSPRTQRKTYPSCTLSATNPTWTDPAAKPGPRGEMLTTNRMSSDTSYLRVLPSMKCILV